MRVGKRFYRGYNKDMPYEWDETKRQATLVECGIDFASMDYFEWDTAIHRPSDRHGEGRWASLGLIAGRLHHVVWTERGENIRIVSLRLANRRERRDYERAR